MEPIKPRKIVNFGPCPGCGIDVLMSHRRSWVMQPDGLKKWKHKDCISASDKEIPPIGSGLPDPEPGLSVGTLPDTIPASGGPTASEVEKIAKILEPYLHPTPTKPSLDVEAIKAIIKTEIDSRLPVTHQWVDLSGKVTGTIDDPHFQLKTLLYHVQKGENVYLWGGPGGGKSTASHQVARIMNLEFGYASMAPSTPESKLMGFIDAGGRFTNPLFHKIYSEGGIFCIDEMDNSSTAVLTSLNACLENGYASFPSGMVKRHEKFICICGGNTPGRGANPRYPERRQFDSGFMERFVYMEWKYDEALERKLALKINPKAGPWVDFILKLRRECDHNHKKVIVTPRASLKGANYLLDDVLTEREILDAVVFKGVDTDTADQILRAVPLPNVRGN